MELKKRRKTNNVTLPSDYVQVVEELITLEELGFKENNFHDWKYNLISHEGYSKDIIASGDYLYLQEHEEGNSKDLCILWNKDKAGRINRIDLNLLIKLLEKGNARKKKSN